MGKILDIAEDLWTGRKDTFSHHPFGIPRGLELIDEHNSQRTWFYRGFSNSVIRETNEGLIIVDPGAHFDVDEKYKAVREVTSKRVITMIFTHGHVDHVGIKPYMEEWEKNHWPVSRIVAHEAIINRFDRYKLTNSWNAYINLRQFRGDKGEPFFKKEYYYPNLIYKDEITIQIAGVKVQLKHSRGETDDHTWVYFSDTNILCTGDLFIWGVPNAGNPQKVQRYAHEWVLVLREMKECNPIVLCPGHGVPIIGQERISEALDNTALFLESLHTQVISLMNEGVSLDAIIHTVKIPDELLKKPYLKPVYDEPEFIIRNIWRLYGGWYDGIPSHLKPAPETTQARELANLAGGAVKLAERALEFMNKGELRMACHLAEWAWLSSPDNKYISDIASKVFIDRVIKERSTMAMGIYLSAARTMGGDPDKEMPGRTVIQAQELRNQSVKG
ncbi:MAG: alkyl sulfatase dimerization domain-containing protein [Candidatus Thorarchaeota archaeon]